MSYGVRKDCYQSKVWKQTKNNVWLKQHLLCNRCHKPVYVDGISDYLPKDKRRTGIVHHKTFLNDKDCILLAANPIAKNEVIAKKEPIFARILKEVKQS